MIWEEQWEVHLGKNFVRDVYHFFHIRASVSVAFEYLRMEVNIVFHL